MADEAASSSLDALPVRGGFRMRGMEMTRIETFTDAAFAFAVTLLVISIDEIPKSYDDLINMLRGIPAFAMSFGLLMVFWSGHWKWSRRFGLEDGPSILLSLGLVFVVLCYVYPLKYLSTLFVDWATRQHSTTMTGRDLYNIFAIYGTGFVLMSSLIIGLNLHAWRLREKLQLNAVEQGTAKAEVGAWLIVGGAGLVSVLLTLLTPPSYMGWPGWVYATLAIIMPLYGWWSERRYIKVAQAP